VETHRRTNADATLHLVRVQDPRAFGCVPTDDDGRVTAFLEKTEDPPTDQINAGCYVFRRDVIESVPEGRPVSVERETFPGLLASGARMSGHVDVAYWRDMGTPLDLVKGSADLVRGVAPSAALPGPIGEHLLLDGASVHPTARVFGGTTVGRNVTIGKGARVEGSMLFDGAVVADEARVISSVVGFGARVDRGAVVHETVVGDRAVVGAQCELRRGVRVWPDVVLPPRGVRFSPDV
jgi:mannose-1-phosphate guanylyltransferase